MHAKSHRTKVIIDLKTAERNHVIHRIHIGGILEEEREEAQKRAEKDMGGKTGTWRQ